MQYYGFKLRQYEQHISDIKIITKQLQNEMDGHIVYFYLVNSFQTAQLLNLISSVYEVDLD